MSDHRPGDRVRIHSPGSIFHGATATLDGLTESGPVVRLDSDDTLIGVFTSELRSLDA